MFELNSTQPRVSVPLRECLVMSVLYGDSHCLSAALFSSDLVSRVVFGITGECPQKVFQSSTSDILLVFAQGVDISGIKVQLESQSHWMGKPVHLKCVRPSGNDVRKFGVVGSVHSAATISKGIVVDHRVKEGDVSLELPFFSGNLPPEEDEVTFAQWKYAVESAKFTSSSSAIHSWIFRSLRNSAAQVARNQGVGASIRQILSSLDVTYGNVLPFDMLMRQFLDVSQSSSESVTGYVVRLEKIFSTMRERFYQGLRKDLHQKMTPFYRDHNIPYMQLLRMAREIEDELCTAEGAQVKGVKETDPQVEEVLAALKDLKRQVEKTMDPAPAKKGKTKWKGLYSCYYCGEPGHWRRTCPKRDHRKRGPFKRGGVPQASSQDQEDSSASPDSSQSSTKPAGKATKKKLATQPQYYNPDPVARMFGRANEAKAEVNGVPTTCLVDTGATVTIVSEDFCDQAGLKIQPLRQLVTISATGGTPIPYLGYIVATLEFSHIPNYSEEVVMLVISDTTANASRVPLQIGTRVIAAVAETLTPADIQHLHETWKQTYIGTLMSCAAQQKKNQDGDPFDLDDVKGPAKLRKEVEIQPFEEVKVWAYTQVRGHSKQVVVCTESEELLMKGQVMCVNSKTEMLPHNCRVEVQLRNLTARSVRVPAKTTLGEVSACNVVPPI